MAKAKSIVGVDPQARLAVNAALIIGTRLGEMLDYEPYIEQLDCVYELHQMRIAAKRLRYTMEMFQDAYNAYTRFGKPFAVAITEIKKLQEHLGEIHDADVLAPQLTEHAARLMRNGYGEDKRGLPIAGVHRTDFDACIGLLALCKEIRAERDARYEKLLSHWRELRAQDYFENLRGLLRDAMLDLPSPAEETRSGGAPDLAVAHITQLT